MTITDVWHQVRNGKLIARTDGLEFHVYELSPEAFHIESASSESPKVGASAAGHPTAVPAINEDKSSPPRSGAVASSEGSRMPQLPDFKLPDLFASSPEEVAEAPSPAPEAAAETFQQESLDLDELSEEQKIEVSEDDFSTPLQLEDHVSEQRPESATSTEVALLLDHLSLAKEENREILRLTQDSIAKISQMAETMMAMKDEILKQKSEEVERLNRVLRDREQTISHLKQEVEDFTILTRSLGESSYTP